MFIINLVQQLDRGRRIDHSLGTQHGWREGATQEMIEKCRLLVFTPGLLRIIIKLRVSLECVGLFLTRVYR